jgi:hypothetical protein
VFVVKNKKTSQFLTRKSKKCSFYADNRVIGGLLMAKI